MDEIPEDVRETAKAAFRAFSPLEDAFDAFNTTLIVEAIARAIMAERERCANLAEDAAIDVPIWMNHPQGREDQARISIAAVIRKGPTP